MAGTSYLRTLRTKVGKIENRVSTISTYDTFYVDTGSRMSRHGRDGSVRTGRVPGREFPDPSRSNLAGTKL